MIELADDTGGEAAVNTKALTHAVRRAVESSVATYQVGFDVHKNSLDGKFHELKLKVRRSGLSIQYPRGYFAAEGLSGAHQERDYILATATHSPFERKSIGPASQPLALEPLEATV